MATSDAVTKLLEASASFLSTLETPEGTQAALENARDYQILQIKEGEYLIDVGNVGDATIEEYRAPPLRTREEAVNRLQWCTRLDATASDSDQEGDDDETQDSEEELDDDETQDSEKELDDDETQDSEKESDDDETQDSEKESDDEEESDDEGEPGQPHLKRQSPSSDEGQKKSMADAKYDSDSSSATERSASTEDDPERIMNRHVVTIGKEQYMLHDVLGAERERLIVSQTLLVFDLC